MHELDYQKLLIKVVKDHGGFAYKSGSRFLVGVADVFFTFRTVRLEMKTGPEGYVEIPPMASGFLECKLDPLPVRKTTVSLDTTVKQCQFLNNIIKGGARGAVMSFIRNPKLLGVAIVAPDVLTVPLDEYRIDSHQKREALVWAVLEEWLNEGR